MKPKCPSRGIDRTTSNSPGVCKEEVKGERSVFRDLVSREIGEGDEQMD